VCELDPENPADYSRWAAEFDTAICVNVLETAGDPAMVLRSLHGCVKPGGNVVVLVPQGNALYGTLDQAMGHKHRFSVNEIESLLTGAGFRVERTHQLNKIGAVSWWIYGKLLHRKRIAKVALKLFDKTVWLWRRIDGLMPWRGLSLVVVARRASR
jgi:SAM-dependent methyltransferase